MMNKITGNQQSNIAIDDYLEQLLSVDPDVSEQMVSDAVSESDKQFQESVILKSDEINSSPQGSVTEEADSRHQQSDEQISSQPKRKNVLSGTKLFHIDAHPSRKKQNQQENHQIERVERLLEDFNRRQEVDLEEQPTRVLMPASALQTELPVEGEGSGVDDIEITSDTDVVEVDEDDLIDATENKIWIPEDLDFQREDWSQEPFQTLLFNVAGLTLALPLLKLGGIHRVKEEITHLIGKPSWFMGITPGHAGNINVIDTAKWVMPEKYQQLEEQGLEYEFIILLGDTNWGLACNDVQTAISQSPDNVRWRSKTGKRPWLAGMMIEEMCALLDVDTLIYLLNENYPR